MAVKDKSTAILTIACFAWLTALIGLSHADQFRYWTTSQGRKSDVKLKVVEQTHDRVKLQREDNGRVVEFPIARLSGEDQQYLRETAGRRKESVAFEPDRQGFAGTAYPFLMEHCLKCHGPESQEGAFRVDEHLPNDFLSPSATERWSEALNMLNTGAMPPTGEPRPDPARVSKIAAWIERERLRAERSRSDRTVVLRRMNREEYNNTIRDLVGVKLDLVDDFPEDPPAGGFDNNGSALTISPLHLELYLKSAQKILDRAIVDESEGPGTIKWRFEMENGLAGSAERRVRLDDNLNRNVQLDCGNRPPHDGMVLLRHWGEGCWINYFTVPHPGEYIIRIRAAGATPPEALVRSEGPKINLRHEHEGWEKNNLDDAAILEKQKQYDMWRGPWVERHYATDRTYRYGPPRLRILGQLGSHRPVLDVYDVTAPVDSPQEYESRVLLPAEKSNLHFSNPYRVPYAPHFNPHYIVQRDDFPRPELFIDWVEIEGPLYDDWPPGSHRRILIDSPNKNGDETAYASDVLADFMRRAYRRPLREGELEPKLALFAQVRANKPSFAEAVKVPLLTVLTSPHFLYLIEELTPRETEEAGDGREPSRALNDYELAARLSYFLWSSMPDDELFALANAGRLNDPTVLHAQVDRMLADTKSQMLVKNFAGQWLELRKVGTNPPDAPRYDEHLEISMRGETEAFFEHLLRNDRSALEFLSCDYIVINERLARFYDIQGVQGDRFRPIPVPENAHRGGLIGQASILSITSNGTRTSPVWRGEWILKNLLGDPPPPPPPNAGDIPPVEQGSAPVALRERLRLHREQPQCARCHNKIDPLGLALENFDHSGQWREKDGNQRNSPVIDASARLPDGTEFEGVDGLRRELLKREDQFLRCLAEKMYTYALGRKLGYADQELIDDTVEAMQAEDRTLRSLMHYIVSSDAFRRK